MHPTLNTSFFTDILTRQGLTTANRSTCSPSYVSPLDLLSRDELLYLWQASASDESLASRLETATRIYLRSQALLFGTKLLLSPPEAPLPPVRRVATVRQAALFATYPRSEAVQVATTS